MNANEPRSGARIRTWYREQDCSLREFVAALDPGADDDALRFATNTVDHVPVYDCRELGAVLEDASRRADLQAEWANVLNAGAGVLVLKRVYADKTPVDAATAVFESIIREEHEAGSAAADHFAKAGANDRIWNAQEKLCLRAPSVFASYFASPVLVAVAEAWLGPHFQVTSQVNVVRPGGQAQQAHRDYHLGFQTVAQAERYPAHVHAMSPFLTLQGAIAHSDMPVESGPTKLLPFSQRYAEGYLAWRRQDFRDYFETHYVQLPLEKGDALFFNPALFHAAGENRTASVHRMANLLQISSAYGRAMESLNRTKMCEVLHPVLLDRMQTKSITHEGADAVIASSAEGYPFPTNLDKDPPQGGLAPESQQGLFRRALAESWSADSFVAAVRKQAGRREA
ncbi:Phytanoyl-CoA dioxygenase (PhyH) [Caballeronia arationis]|jgi:ectoine hydroxylase-related dioxygenase (phytanoyl-CoA dioxygenase family)|uniref:Ectoine hydroxylase-related dioxygenase, phytanoyl-CoA dioxygenase (PhyH) family n=1 Tax=Caballeronia arationis TaxID=1777142 RepID=A0A7Z7ID55_9BURK|nr:phytanoyl-CoA dioxygenase family protein [Caballeronia arationis]SAK97610.1 Phytanoyl-CoA dioxygenase (PhyH) [Caballeronia arationis]SOE88563.1 Ectoine hydroxylase-related dioxygenase, phytanoyl-CoA dioxygenase (PhyH) family [Caballeronia arationis]